MLPNPVANDFVTMGSISMASSNSTVQHSSELHEYNSLILIFYQPSQVLDKKMMLPSALDPVTLSVISNLHVRLFLIPWFLSEIRFRIDTGEDQEL